MADAVRLNDFEIDFLGGYNIVESNIGFIEKKKEIPALSEVINEGRKVCDRIAYGRIDYDSRFYFFQQFINSVSQTFGIPKDILLSKIDVG